MRCRHVVWTGLLLAGCGRVGFDARTGSGSDMPDSSIDAADGFVTVITISRSGTGGKAAVRVWSSRRDGSVDDAQLTDASGMATLHVETGGAVSAAYDPSQEFVVATWNVHTILGVEPGDTLRFGGQPPTCDMTPRGSATINFAAAAGAISYRVATGCGPQYVPTSPFLWSLTAADPNPGDVVVTAYDATNTVVGSASASGVALPDGATASFVAGDWHAPISTMVGVSGVPSGLTTVLLLLTSRLATRDLVTSEALYSGLTPTGGTATVNAALPDVGTRVSIHVTATDLAGHTVHYIDAGAPGIVALPPLPPALASPTFDAASQRIDFVQTPGAVVGDRLEASVYLQNTAGEDVGWTVWAPATMTSIVLPVLPPSVTGYDPGLAQNQQPPHVQIVDYPDIIDWHAARSAPEWDSLSFYDGHACVATSWSGPTG
jgi:hypothetical protein